MKNPGLAGILLFNLCIQTSDHLHSDGVQPVFACLIQARLSLTTLPIRAAFASAPLLP